MADSSSKSMSRQDLSFKIILIGDSGVGKTSILNYYTKKMFKDRIQSTIGVDFVTKFEDINGKSIKIALWDTAGQEKYRATTANYYKNSSACFIVFDLTDIDSFNHLEIWIKFFCDNSGIKEKENIVILGNKSDLREERKISEEQIDEFISKQNFVYYETSAKNGENIDKCFKDIAEKLIEQYNNKKTNTNKPEKYTKIENKCDKTIEENKKCC